MYRKVRKKIMDTLPPPFYENPIILKALTGILIFGFLLLSSMAIKSLIKKLSSRKK